MKECPYCHKQNADDANVCIQCHAGFPNDEQKHETAADETVRSRKKKTRSE